MLASVVWKGLTTTAVALQEKKKSLRVHSCDKNRDDSCSDQSIPEGGPTMFPDSCFFGWLDTWLYYMNVSCIVSGAEAKDATKEPTLSKSMRFRGRRRILSVKSNSWATMCSYTCYMWCLKSTNSTPDFCAATLQTSRLCVSSSRKTVMFKRCGVDNVSCHNPWPELVQAFLRFAAFRGLVPHTLTAHLLQPTPWKSLPLTATAAVSPKPSRVPFVSFCLPAAAGCRWGFVSQPCVAFVVATTLCRPGSSCCAEFLPKRFETENMSLAYCKYKKKTTGSHFFLAFLEHHAESESWLVCFWNFRI